MNPFSRSLLRPLSFAAFAVVVASGPAASAQADDAARRAAAQALFDEAMQLLKLRDFARACPKLEEVNSLQPGKIGAMMELGACYEAWGKITSAWARYRTASDLATKAGDARKAEADAKVAALGPKVPRLVVVVPESMRAVSGLVIETDGVPLGPGAWGTGIPVDPGAHEVAASAPDKRKWSTKIEINRPGDTITVTIPMLTEDGAAAAPAGQFGVATPGPGAPKQQAGWSGQHTAGVAMAGLGVVGLGIMAGFGLDAASKHSASNAFCSADRKYCEQPGLDLEKQAHVSANISNGALAAGATLIAAGALVFVLAPSLSAPKTPTSSPSAPLSVRVSFGPSTAGAVVQGAF